MNGWKNYQTWNVSLWIANEEPLYRAACDFLKTYKGRSPYAAFIEAEGLSGQRTPDNVKWDGTRLDYADLNRFMRELCD